MKKVFALALQGTGLVAPNPLVGAVLMKDGAIIGEGVHWAPGQAHAEVNAILDAESKGATVAGATLVCNLEPCCHHDKRTPPCTELILAKKIKKVVIANLDPNPQVAGKGIEQLRLQGVEVVDEVLAVEGRQLNRVFFHNMEKQLPYVHIKWAQSLDGSLNTGMNSGPDRWLSDEAAREEVHHLRFCYDAIMVGRNTINQDNPLLSIRMGHQHSRKNNYKIVIGRWDKIDPQSNFWLIPDSKKIIFSPTAFDTNSMSAPPPIQVLPLPLLSNQGNRLDYLELLRVLYHLKISSVIVEGGPTLLAGFLRTKLWQQLTVYLCPKFIVNGNCSFQQVANHLMLPDRIDLSMCKINYRQLNQQLVVEANNICSQV